MRQTHKEEEPIANLLGTVHSSEGRAWTADLYLNDTLLEFKFDIGAEVTSDSRVTFQSLIQSSS